MATSRYTSCACARRLPKKEDGYRFLHLSKVLFTAQSINKVNWIKSYYLQEWNLTFSDCKKIKTKWNSSKNTVPIRNASGFIHMKEKEHKLKLCCAHAMYYLDIRFIDSKCFSGGKWKSMLMLVFSGFINDLTIFLQVCTFKNVIKQLMIITKSLNYLIWPWPTMYYWTTEAIVI